MAFTAVRAKEIQLQEYLKDFEGKAENGGESKGYKRLKKIKKAEEFEELRAAGFLAEYQEEIENLKTEVEVIYYLR